MLRTTLQKAYIKRTIRPLYGWTQATPVSGFLDPNWDRSVPIWPGMVMMKTGGGTIAGQYPTAVTNGGSNFTLINGTGYPFGLVGNYIGGDGIDELLDQGINALAVWVLSDDAEFEILAPAFDNTLTWTDPGDGTVGLVYASTAGANRGMLVPAGAANASTRPVARLLSVESASKLIIGGLRGTA